MSFVCVDIFLEAAGKKVKNQRNLPTAARGSVCVWLIFHSMFFSGAYEY